MKLTLEVLPKVFNGFKIRGLGRPIKNLNVIVLEPPLCLLGDVFWIIVLLENLFTLRKVLVFEPLLCCVKYEKN